MKKDKKACWTNFKEELNLELDHEEQLWTGPFPSIIEYYKFPKKYSEVVFEVYQQNKSEFKKNHCSVKKLDGQWFVTEKTNYGYKKSPIKIPEEFINRVSIHKSTYPTFDDKRFMSWVKEKRISPEYLKKANIAMLNKRMRKSVSFQNYMSSIVK